LQLLEYRLEKVDEDFHRPDVDAHRAAASELGRKNSAVDSD
jgi:hypothetical protein